MGCLSTEDCPVDIESEILPGLVRYAREQDGTRQEPMVSLMKYANIDVRVAGEDGTSIEYANLEGKIVSVSEYEAYRSVCSGGVYRSVCSVHLPINGRGYVYVFKTEPSTNVWVNGFKVTPGVKHPLLSGCILSLNGRTGVALQAFNIYPLGARPPSDTTAARLNSKRKIMSDIDVQRIRDEARKSFVAESTCSVCHEVIVRAVSGDGCTHKYCDQCIRKCQHVAESLYILCPQCRVRTIKWFHDPNMDAMIWAGALDGKFKGDLAKTYLQRRAEFGEGVATHDERMCVLDIRYKTGE